MAYAKLRQQLPKDEILWQQYYGGIFLVTSDRVRSKYSLWEKTDGGFRLAATAKTPANFGNIVEKSPRILSQS